LSLLAFAKGDIQLRFSWVAIGIFRKRVRRVGAYFFAFTFGFALAFGFVSLTGFIGTLQHTNSQGSQAQGS
jgi:hypothetical protein